MVVAREVGMCNSKVQREVVVHSGGSHLVVVHERMLINDSGHWK